MHPKPFPCRFPRCTASYQRKSHLRRHEAQHYRPRDFKCSICKQQLGRSDTLRRHMQKMHGVKDLASRIRACANCRDRKLRCQGGSPCVECQRRGIDCSLLSQQTEGEQAQEQQQRPGRNPSSPTELHDSQTRSETPGPSEKQRHYLSLYFRLFHPHWPFIHRGSFRESHEKPLLVQSMVVIGLWLSEEQNAREKAIALHGILGSAIQDQRELWDASISAEASSSCSWPIPTYQAMLLHIIFAALYKSQGQGVPPLQLSLDLKPRLALADADLLNRLVASCRKLGMLFYPNMLARYSKDDLPSYVWVSIEEVKRLNMALFRLCRSDRLHPRDLQFPLPTNTPLWNAVGKCEWKSIIAAGGDIDVDADADADADAYCGRLLNNALKAEWISNFADVFQWS
ncbi:hypothetical protein BDW71DRAFT_194070 [Aspergillus fruticulosus]